MSEPLLTIRIPFEGEPFVVPVCATFDDELRLARYVDQLLTRRKDVLHGLLAHWLLVVENESAA